MTGEFGGSLCVCGHVEKQSFFLDILSMRCLSQIYPAVLLTPILVLHLIIHPVSWQFTVSLWCRKTVSEAYWNDPHWGLSLTRGDLGSPLRHPERTHAILIKVTPEAPKPVTHTCLIRVGISTETHCSQERPRETSGERHSWLMEQSDACMDQGSLGPHPSSWRLTCQASLWCPLHLPSPCPATGSFPGGSDNKKSSRNAKGPGSPLGLKIPWRREWSPTPVFFSGEFQGQRSLAGYRP